jgi:hypothetical protein
MEHFEESRLIEYLWDGIALNEAERAHLTFCPHCQEQLSYFERLREEFAVARRSEVTPEAENRLVALFAQVKQTGAGENLLHDLHVRLAGWVKAVSVWDGRQEAMLGVRGGNRPSYRMLFEAQATEVELMVEAENGLLRIVGEVMVGDGAPGDSTAGESLPGRGLALIELMTYANAKSAIEAESDESGRFALESVPPGRYVMTITPRYSHAVVIESLELT